MAGRQLHYTTLDVFTLTRYTGNPLAVVDVPAGLELSQAEKLKIAREFNLSETVFLHDGLRDSNSQEWTIDIFLKSQEIPFAGHPTIGSAMLLAQRHPTLEKAILKKKSGPIQIAYERSQDGTPRIARASIAHSVRVHSTPVSRQDVLQQQPQLETLLNAERQYEAVSIVKGMTFGMLQLDSREALAKIHTAPKAVPVKLDDGWTPSFVGSYYFYISSSTEGVTKVDARMLESALEDPATGSAASALGSYLALKTGKDQSLLIVQGEDMGQRSEIDVRVKLSASKNSIEEVVLAGSAIQVMQGSLTV